jgi:quercetin dioxygenase-like cupin family protein
MIDKVKIVSNVWFRQIELQQKGEKMKGHSHEFDHIHLLAQGEVRVTVEGIDTDFKAPATIFICKDKEHSLEALTDYSLGFCIRPLRDGFRVEDIINPEDMPTIA